jgi:hypothetical protein
MVFLLFLPFAVVTAKIAFVETRVPKIFYISYQKFLTHRI